MKSAQKICDIKMYPFQHTKSEYILVVLLQDLRIAKQRRNFSRDSLQRMLLHYCSNKDLKTHLQQTVIILNFLLFMIYITFPASDNTPKYKQKVFHTQIHSQINRPFMVAVQLFKWEDTLSTEERR